MSKSVKINGATYENVPKVSIPLAQGEGNADFYDTSADTADAAHILTGKTAHSATGPVTGSMPNNGAVTGTISAKGGKYIVPAGYHNGAGTVIIDAVEQDKLISGNIKAGVTVLGVSGSSSVVETKDGTATAGEIIKGKTAYVNGSKITGALSSISVTQDAITKALTIK
uniref:Tail protein n=1 Tax=Myoviridae sp. ct2th6 TaxID=2826606 RepID=A0A8S5NPB2_9CAUD|nr:MAG TPA: tail protein [Myoviridae sp. ct2th6]